VTLKKQKILFLAANPGETHRGALDREAHSIQGELKRSGYRDRFAFETRWAMEPLDLLRELRVLEPAVVHLSGHGGQDGLYFRAADGGARLVSTAALAETFGAAGSTVKLVVLSACYSEAQAEALLAHVDCVVGMGRASHEDAARIFAIGFYGGLGEHASIAAAYRHGCAAIRLEGLPEGERPQLKVRDGFDAERFVLAAECLPESAGLPCPYPGLQPYSPDTAEHFHGRDAEIEDLIGQLRAGKREIYVVGPSGCGKSSLVEAGLLPKLARGVAGLGPFAVRTMRPGGQPTARLSEALGATQDQLATPANAIAALLEHRAPTASVLLVIDQLEELFTQASPGERARFLVGLQALRAEPRCVVVATLRADFFGDFMESPLWTDRPGKISHIDVNPLRGDTLREAIVRPARDLGVTVEAKLLEQLLADASDEPRALPLLQETLVQLWDHQQDRTLTLAAYQALGNGDRSGLAVALSRRADQALRELIEAQEPIARRILLGLISFGEGRPDTRRQQRRSMLRAAGDTPDFDAVLQHLIANRLLTTDDDPNDERVDLAHEVIITAWPTLAGWIQTRRANELRRGQLEAAAGHRGGPWLRDDPAELAARAPAMRRRASGRRWWRGDGGQSSGRRSRRARAR